MNEAGTDAAAAAAAEFTAFLSFFYYSFFLSLYIYIDILESEEDFQKVL